MNRQTEEAVAVKVIDTSQAKECAENVKKEVCVHKVSHSPFLVSYICKYIYGRLSKSPRVH